MDRSALENSLGSFLSTTRACPSGGEAIGGIAHRSERCLSTADRLGVLPKLVECVPDRFILAPRPPLLDLVVYELL
jgi:hypothetical protein